MDDLDLHDSNNTEDLELIRENRILTLQLEDLRLQCEELKSQVGYMETEQTELKAAAPAMFDNSHTLEEILRGTQREESLKDERNKLIQKGKEEEITADEIDSAEWI